MLAMRMLTGTLPEIDDTWPRISIYKWLASGKQTQPPSHGTQKYHEKPGIQLSVPTIIPQIYEKRDIPLQL